MEEQKFDYEAFEKEAIEQLKKGKKLEGKGGVLAPLLQRLLNASLHGELDAHLQEGETQNRRNGKGTKKVKTSFGEIEIDSPRDRESSFSPQIVRKRQLTLGDGIDHKVISLYAKGMSYESICEHLEDLYGITLSPATLSAITDRIMPEVYQWQNRPLEALYPIVWLDAVHYKVRSEGRIVHKAVYHVLGVGQDGIKEILGMYIGEKEGAKFWLQVLSDLQNRGVKDILIACIDNLTGFKEAIESIFPKTDVQLCVIHQIRNSFKYLRKKDYKEFVADLRLIYTALNYQEGERNLDKFDEKWGKQYPAVIRSWRNNWDGLSTFFHYPYELRRLMYTTNIIESYHSQLRKITKSKRIFPNDAALLKLLYLITIRITEKWSRPIKNWKNTLAQLSILYEERMNPE
ncbi:IS256 family transposase [Prolixibacter sp. NT017]|uniref:IS256 family transposase n=1 Tax=Prolixibacter sp. NT017 TaxID=2652390 RepID=UPI001288D3C6|nr:IS256 family transposase [Prolixibacter sp. NT017]GET24184.1 IS256 family transposase [Prolixibacter sp. NT017]GET25415.1 IS256 family transposase [Prolixibacter sp. NT017]